MKSTVGWKVEGWDCRGAGRKSTTGVVGDGTGRRCEGERERERQRGREAERERGRVREKRERDKRERDLKRGRPPLVVAWR